MKKLYPLIALIGLFVLAGCPQPQPVEDPVLTPIKTEYSIGAEGGEMSITFKTNQTYKVKSSATWLTVSTTPTKAVTTETVKVTVIKAWDDAEDQDGLRPDTLPVTLSNGSVVVLSGENGWTATAENLPKFAKGEPITYTWTESNTVEGYKLTGTAVSADGLTTTLTNTHEPAITEITGTKAWADNNNNDGSRPASITVKLLADGEAVRTQAVTGDDWNFSFTNLPVYKEGKPITYTVDEDAVSGYVKTVTGNATEGFTITNTHDAATITVSGTKA